MGKWRNRPIRRFYRKERDWRPLYDDEPLVPPSGFNDDGVPAWEKKFCAFIGSMPWRKVVDSKMFMYCHKNIVNWDDSAGEEAFQNAKNRFWAQINGLPCDIPLPDPDIYIGEINWKPDIDHQLVKELEQAFFVPAEEGKDWNAGRRSKKTRNLASEPSEWCNKNSPSVDNPWECDNSIQGAVPLKNLTQGQNQWTHDVNDSGKLNDDDNPWGHAITQGNEAAENGWGDSAGQSWGWYQGRGNTEQLRNLDNGSNPWDNRQSTGSAKNKGWDNSGVNAWGWNQPDSRKLINGDSSWGHNSVQDKGAPKDRGWRTSRGNSWGSKQRDYYHREPENWGHEKNSGGRRNWDRDLQKREGSHPYASKYNNSRFQGDDYRADNCWRGANAEKRVSFTME